MLVIVKRISCAIILLMSKLTFYMILNRYLFEAKNPLDVWPSWTGVKSNDEFDYIFGRPLHDATLLGNNTLYNDEDILISRL